MGSYVPTTAAEREQMLSKIGVESMEELYAAVPREMLLQDGLDRGGTGGNACCHRGQKP